jgi:hypothetical protein
MLASSLKNSFSDFSSPKLTFLEKSSLEFEVGGFRSGLLYYRLLIYVDLKFRFFVLEEEVSLVSLRHFRNYYSSRTRTATRSLLCRGSRIEFLVYPSANSRRWFLKLLKNSQVASG